MVTTIHLPPKLTTVNRSYEESCHFAIDSCFRDTAASRSRRAHTMVDIAGEEGSFESSAFEALERDFQQVLTELAEKGNYDNLKAALDKLLPRLLG